MRTYTEPQAHNTAGDTQNVAQKLFRWLLVFLCLLELCALLLIAISPLSGLHLSDSPIKNWTWTLLPSRALLALFPMLKSASGHSASILLGSILLGFLLIYTCAIVAVMRFRGPFTLQRHFLFLLLGGILLIGLTLFFQPLLLSDDVFTYIFSGRILAVYGADPLNTAPIQYPHDLYYQWVLSGRYLPNIYGPLWLCISALLAAIGTTVSNPAFTLLLFKGTALGLHLINTLLVWKILHKIAPARCLLGTLLYAWNPLALIELTGSAHNEGLLVCLLLCAAWLLIQPCTVKTRLAALLVLGLAISANLLALLIAPLYLWFDLRGERSLGRAIWQFCWYFALMMVPALVISLPFWRGDHTFFAVTSAVDMEHFVHAPAGLLALPLRSVFTYAATAAHLPTFLNPTTAADVTLRASTTFIFILIYFDLVGQVRQAPIFYPGTHIHKHDTDKLPYSGFDILFSSCSIIIFWYLILVSGWFWPWYLLWMLWAVVLSRIDAFTSAMLVLSGTALFIYPFVGFTQSPLATYQSALIFGIPLVYLLCVRIKERYTERIGNAHGRRGQTTQN